MTIGVFNWEGGLCDDWEFSSSAGENLSDTEFVQFNTIGAMGGGAAGNRLNPRVAMKVVDTAVASTRVFTTTEGGEHGSGVEEAVVTANSDNRHTAYGYPSGSTMDSSFTAPANRAFNGFLRVDTSAGTEAVNESTAGYVLNEAGWAMAVDVPVDWALGHSLTTDRQLGVPITESSLGAWTAPTNGVLDIDDEIPSISDFYESNTSDTVLVLKLTSLTDPANDALHHLMAAFAKAGAGSADPTLTMELRQGWVSEPSSLGTLIGTVDAIVPGGTETEYAGVMLALTETEADSITDYTDLYARFVYTADSNAEVTIANVRWLIDGAAAAVAAVYPPFPRRQNTLVRM